jgi:hypothetical protein
MLEDIYEKLRKKGVARGEYAIENLAFKELRNKGYLDQFKEYRNELTSKRLSLEESLIDKLALIFIISWRELPALNQLFKIMECSLFIT